MNCISSILLCMFRVSWSNIQDRVACFLPQRRPLHEQPVSFDDLLHILHLSTHWRRVLGLIQVQI